MSAIVDAKEDEVLYDRRDAGIRRQILEQYNLLRRPNVVFTPQIAFNSRDAVQRILDTTVDNVRAFLV
jgi:lactate dehydrogenase-like 2-hydroxyacid dehydrogenase